MMGIPGRLPWEVVVVPPQSGTINSNAQICVVNTVEWTDLSLVGEQYLAVCGPGLISMRVKSCFWIQPHVPLDICVGRRELTVEHKSQIYTKQMVSRKV
jgi:hypothetical protein